jgi:hypothetical protein
MAREIVRLYRQNLAGSVDPLLAEDALDDNFLDDAIFRGTSATVKVTKSTVSFDSTIGGQWNQTIRPGPQLGHYNELRRVTYAVRWAPLEEAEFVTANDPFITYMETARL